MNESLIGENTMSILKRHFSTEDINDFDRWEEQLEKETNSAFETTIEKLFENDYSPNDNTEIVDVLYYIKSCISKSNLFDKSDNIRSYFLGIWETLYRIQFEIINKSIEENVLQNILSSYKYIKQFIQFIYVNNMPTQSEIAEHLGIEVNTLSNFLSRINKYSLYSVQKLGKQKHFNITKKGCLLYKYISDQNTNNFDENAFFDFFIRFLKSLADEMQNDERSIENVLTRSCPENLSIPFVKKPYLVKKYLYEILNYNQTNKVRYDSFIQYFHNKKDRYLERIEFLPLEFNIENTSDDIIFYKHIVDKKSTISDKFEIIKNDNKYYINILKG